MRDGCSLARLGKPVVVVVQATFESAARVHAEGLGCPDLSICSYPHPSPGAPSGPEIMAELASNICAQIGNFIAKSEAVVSKVVDEGA